MAKLIAALLLAVLACRTAEVFPSVQGETRPNVLFIWVDDMNEWVTPFNNSTRGKPLIKTPNVQALADQGAAFLNAHTPVPICSPARASVMTGLYPRNGKTMIAQYNQGKKEFSDTTTMTQHFSEHGYTTLGIGKIMPPLLNPERQWDLYEAFDRDPGELKMAPPLNGFELPGNDPLDWGAVDYKYEDMTDVRLAERAVNLLKKAYNKPFFLGVGFHLPHLPWYLPQIHLDQYPLDSIELPDVLENDLQDISSEGRRIAWKSPRLTFQGYENSDHFRILRSGQWRRAVQAYMSATTFVDDLVGKILAALTHTPYAEKTIVVLFSDNGFHLGEKQHWRKMSLWEESTRVPLIISYPKLLKPMQVKSAVSLVDIYPTLLQLTGLPGPKYQLDGKSLVPVMRNLGQEDGRVVISVWEEAVAARDAQYRYIWYKDGSEELYDHKDDPMEHFNLLAAPESAKLHAELIARFKMDLGQYHQAAARLPGKAGSQ